MTAMPTALSNVLYCSAPKDIDSKSVIPSFQTMGLAGEVNSRPTGHQHLGESVDEADLLFSLEKKHQPPCQYSIEGSIKHSRVLNSFAENRDARQVALECCDEGGCCIYTEDMQSLFDQYHRNGEAGPAPQIDDAAPGRQCSGPLPHLLHADSSRRGFAAAR